MSLIENQDLLDLLKASVEAMKMKSNHDNFETVTIVPAELGWKTRPSELELRIRREVMKDVDKMIACESDGEEYYKSILLRIKDRLNLLWGSNE